MKNIIFLDIDGVLNCQIFYEKRGQSESIIEHPQNQICTERVGWLNNLCSETESAVVISSTWRHSGLEYCKDVLQKAGATFEIIDITPSLHVERGCEIQKWLRDNVEKYFDVKYFDFYRYAIIDDDSDMLLWQQQHFFQTDPYSGLTPTTCYKIKRFFTHKTF